MGIAELIGVVLGSQVIVAAVSGWLQRKKTNADAAAVLSAEQLKWAQHLTDQLRERDKVVDDLRNQVMTLSNKVSTLEGHATAVRELETALVAKIATAVADAVGKLALGGALCPYRAKEGV